MENEIETIVEHVDVPSDADTRDGEPAQREADTPQVNSAENWEERYKQLQSIFTKQSQELKQEREKEKATASVAKQEPPTQPASPPPPAVIGSGATFTKVGAKEPRSMRESAQLVRELFSRK